MPVLSKKSSTTEVTEENLDNGGHGSLLQSSTTEFTDEKHVNRGRGSLLYKTKPCPPFASVSSVVALFSLFVAVGSAQAPSAADWTQFRGNARLTGVAAAALPSTLSLRWAYKVGDAIESSPAIADGVVFVGSAGGDQPTAYHC